MWIIILVAVLIIGFVIFKKYDKDFIKCTRLDNGYFFLEFENEKTAEGQLVKTYLINNKSYSVFIPIEEIKKAAVPMEDVIILQSYKEKSGSVCYVFADSDTDEIIFQDIKKTINVSEN